MGVFVCVDAVEAVEAADANDPDDPTDDVGDAGDVGSPDIINYLFVINIFYIYNRYFYFL